MAETVYMKFNCLNPECGKPIQLPRPERSGTYAITCPHCKVKKNLKLKGIDAYNGTQSSQSVQTDNSEKEPVELLDDFVVGQEYSFKCPHCNAQEIGFKTDIPGLRAIPCPNCQGKIKFDVRKKTEKIILTDTVQTFKGKLILLRRGWLNKDFKLEKGKYVIGRYDEDEPSDIQIKNDDSISRRSIVIEVKHSEKGYTFKLTVLKATNPVLHNNVPLMAGESVSLNFGDSIIMGKTKFRFDKDS